MSVSLKLSRRSAVAALASFIAVTPGAFAAEKIVIGHSQPNLGWPYIAAVTNALEAAAKGLEGVEVVTLSADGDIAKQSSDIATLVNRKVNVLLVTSLDGNAVVPALKKAADAGIPILAVSNEPSGVDAVDAALDGNRVGGQISDGLANFIDRDVGVISGQESPIHREVSVGRQGVRRLGLVHDLVGERVSSAKDWMAIGPGDLPETLDHFECAFNGAQAEIGTTGMGHLTAHMHLDVHATAVSKRKSQIGAVLIILIWGGAAWWLFNAGATGWAAFMLVWGLMVNTSDNFIRPWLISFGVNMPIALVILGVFGGFLSFGFLGLFIGPSLLAIAYVLLEAWRSNA